MTEPVYIPGLVVSIPTEWTKNDLPVVYSVAVMYLGIHGALVSSVYVRGLPNQAKLISEGIRGCINPPFDEPLTGNVFVNVWSLSDAYHEMVMSNERNVDMRTRFTVKEGFTQDDHSSVYSDDPAV
jgi:hypothetical protein